MHVSRFGGFCCYGDGEQRMSGSTDERIARQWNGRLEKGIPPRYLGNPVIGILPPLGYEWKIISHDITELLTGIKP